MASFLTQAPLDAAFLLIDGAASWALKPIEVIAYLSFGSLLVLHALRVSPLEGGQAVSNRLAAVLLALGGGLLVATYAFHNATKLAMTLIGAILLLTYSRDRVTPRFAASAGAATALAVSLAWWADQPRPHDWVRIVAFAAVTGALHTGLIRSEPPAAIRRYFLFGSFALASLLLLLDAANYADPSMLHHWGAYIGSAEHLRAGLVPFYDVPLQYGLGPTLLIASGCSLGDCWVGMHVLSSLATTLMGLLLLGLALNDTTREAPKQLVVALVMFGGMFFGSAFIGIAPNIFPSTGGLRFLPVCAVAFLLFNHRHRSAALALIPAALWSPESAYMSAVVFGTSEIARSGLLAGSLATGGIVAGSYAMFVGVHRALFGIWLDPEALFEYVLHVPGVLPMNVDGPLLLLVGTLALGIWSLRHREPHTEPYHRDLVVLSLLFATTSYYLGRSHDNNVCNLLPFMLCVALRALACSKLVGNEQFRRLIALGIAGAIGVFTLSPFQLVPFRHAFDLSIENTLARMADVDPDIAIIRAGIPNPEHLGIANLVRPGNRDLHESAVWTAMDPYSLFQFVPRARRRVYISRSAVRLRRPGWIILDGSESRLLEDFRVAYDISAESVHFGVRAVSFGGARPASHTYVVARLVPKMAVEKEP